MSPNEVMGAVFGTGRSRRQAPSTEMSSIARSSWRSGFRQMTRTMPFSSAIPESAINPTEAETDRPT